MFIHWLKFQQIIHNTTIRPRLRTSNSQQVLAKSNLGLSLAVNVLQNQSDKCDVIITSSATMNF